MNLLGLLFFGLLAVGVPIAFVLAGSATLYIVVIGGIPLSTIPQRLFAGLDQFVLMSIPFFILAGFLMNAAGLTERLIQFADYLVGKWRAGLAQANVVTSLFFGGITGAATADVAAIGPIMIPAMVKQGYSREIATAVTVASSIVGPLLPPSIPLLVYGISSGASIGSLFLAGVMPGLVAGFALLVLNRFLFRHMAPSRGVAGNGTRLEYFVGFWKSLRVALIALAMPVIIVGGVVGGVFTPTESAVAAVVYAGVVGMAMRTIDLKVLATLVTSAAILSSTIMLIVAGANLLGWVLAFERIPQAIASLFLEMTDNRWVFLAIVVVILLIVGLFLETSGAIVILTPVLLPAALAYGFDAVHFGIVMVFGLVIGLITPPVGLCLFVGCSVGNVQLHRLAAAVMPYTAVITLVYIVFVFWPDASLWLPNLFNARI